MGAGDALHEGMLEVRVLREGVRWDTRAVTVEPGRLAWRAAGGAEAQGQELALNAQSEVHLVKYGLKKFAFEVEAGGRSVALAAASDEERADWIRALESACGVSRLTKSLSLRSLGSLGSAAAEADVISPKANSLGGARPKSKAASSARAQGSAPAQSVAISPDVNAHGGARPKSKAASSAGAQGKAAGAGAIPSEPEPSSSRPRSTPTAALAAAVAAAPAAAAQPVSKLAAFLAQTYKSEQAPKPAVTGDLESLLGSLVADAAAPPPAGSGKGGVSAARQKFAGGGAPPAQQPKASKEKAQPAAAGAAGKERTGKVPKSTQTEPADEAALVARSVAEKTAAERIQERLGGMVSFDYSNDLPPCAQCSKKIYSIEQVSVEGKRMHKACFCCAKCSLRLQPGNYASIGDKYLCRPHYVQTLRSMRKSSMLMLDSPEEAAAALADEEPLVVASVAGASVDKAEPGRERPEGSRDVGSKARAESEDTRASASRRSARAQSAAQRKIEAAEPPRRTSVDEKDSHEDDPRNSDDDSDDDSDDKEVEAQARRPAPIKRSYSAPAVVRQESTPLKHVALLSRARLYAPRRRLPRMGNSALPRGVPKNSDAKVLHANTFKLDDGRCKLLLTLHCSSEADKEQWVARLASAVHLKQLEAKLTRAQRIDMMSALQAQAELENFKRAHGDITCEGYIEVLVAGGPLSKKGKGKRKPAQWTKMLFKLGGGHLVYRDDKAKGKKGKPVDIEIGKDSAPLDLQHRILRIQR
jgi:hypothetical protein